MTAPITVRNYVSPSYPATFEPIRRRFPANDPMPRARPRPGRLRLPPVPRGLQGIGRDARWAAGRFFPIATGLVIVADLYFAPDYSECTWSEPPGGNWTHAYGPCGLRPNRTTLTYFSRINQTPPQCVVDQSIFPAVGSEFGPSYCGAQPSEVDASVTRYNTWRHYQSNAGVKRSQVIEHWTRPAGTPGEKVPTPYPRPKVKLLPGTPPEYMPTPKARRKAESKKLQDNARARDSSEQVSEDTKRAERTRTKRQPKPRRPRGKEKKARTSLQVVLRMLDWLSESAEIVDAIYDALPADVRARWGRGRDNRGMLDQAGQYGIDGADWKLQALYHNWHKIDWDKAFRNIGNNIIEDAIIGWVAKNAPPGTLRAVTGFRGHDAPNIFTLPPDVF